VVQALAGASEKGRWGGRLTKRPLPLDDDAIDALDIGDRRELARFWLGRAAGERRVSKSCQVIRDALAGLRAPTELVALAERAIDDELRHAEIWRLGASRYWGEPLDEPEPWPLVVPHIDAPPKLRNTLYVIGQCVFNETTASAFLETCLSQAKGRLATAVLREILSDEIDHGRIGWAFTAWLSSRRRAEVNPWLVPMAHAHLREWRRACREVPATFAAHGVPSRADTEGAVMHALHELIIPGLASLEFSTDGMRQVAF